MWTRPNEAYLKMKGWGVKETSMDERYFYAVGDRRNGPVSFAALRDLATKGELGRAAKVWCQGMKEWQAADSVTKLFDDLPPDLLPETVAVLPPPLLMEESKPESLWAKSCPRVERSGAEFMKKERQIFIAGYPIGLVFALVAGYLGQDSSDANMAGIVICALLGTGALILAFVNWLTLHHRLWKLLPPAMAETTPAKAVGLFFVPLFNVYWCFVTFKGLATGANKTLAALGEREVHCSDGLALAFSIAQACALSLGAVVPILGLIAAIASYVLWIPWYADLAKAFVVIEKCAKQTSGQLVAQPQTATA